MDCKAAGRVGLVVSWQSVGWRCMDGKGGDVLAHGDAVKTFVNVFIFNIVVIFLFILLLK